MLCSCNNLRGCHGLSCENLCSSLAHSDKKVYKSASLVIELSMGWAMLISGLGQVDIAYIFEI